MFGLRARLLCLSPALFACNEGTVAVAEETEGDGDGDGDGDADQGAIFAR